VAFLFSVDTKAIHPKTIGTATAGSGVERTVVA
jgi:hypothetical protein